jgi:hypothetical protein
MTDVVARIRAICMALPEVTERPSHSTPTWFIRDKKTFATLWPDGHHQADFAQLWCAAPVGVAQELIASAPATYFYPAYVGHRGWVGVRLDSGVDGGIDWVELGEVLEDAYRTIAPKSLIALLDASSRQS